MTTTEGQEAAYAYWEPYHALTRSDDGPSVMLRYLLDYPVDTRALTYGYDTDAKASDKLASDPVVAVLHEIAERGICPHDMKASRIISNKTFTDLVHKAGGRNMSPEAIALKTLALVPHVERLRKAQYLERLHSYTDSDGRASVTPLMETRQRGFYLGTLTEFRTAVSRITLRRYGEEDDGISYDPTDFDLEHTSGRCACEAPAG